MKQLTKINQKDLEEVFEHYKKTTKNPFCIYDVFEVGDTIWFSTSFGLMSEGVIQEIDLELKNALRKVEVEFELLENYPSEFYTTCESVEQAIPNVISNVEKEVIDNILNARPPYVDSLGQLDPSNKRYYNRPTLERLEQLIKEGEEYIKEYFNK